LNTNRRSLVCVSIVLAVVLLACSSTGAAPTSAPTAQPPTAIPPTATQRPTPTPPPTATPNLAATQQYSDMQALILTLVSRGYLNSADGKYYHMDDFSNAWAQLNWYSWTPTSYFPSDFVLRANFSWESASQTPNPSGCGIVFHLQSNQAQDNYMVFVSTDGYVYMGGMVANSFNLLGSKYYGKSGYKGKAVFTLVVVGNRYRVLIDDKSVGTFVGYDGRLVDGNLAYTIVSGTNLDYGTRCEMTNVDLWQINP
jgi:hypothetical protein